MAQYTISKSLVDKIRSNSDSIRNSGPALGRNGLGKKSISDIIVMVTGPYTGTAFSGYPVAFSYAGYEVMTDDNGAFVDVSGRVFGNDALSTSLPPILNINEMSHVYSNLDYDKTHILPSSYIRAFRTGGGRTLDLSGDSVNYIQWYCDEALVDREKSFGSVYENSSGTIKCHINDGQVYAQDLSTNVDGGTFALSATGYVYVEASHAVGGTNWSVVSPVQFSVSRPTEIYTDLSYRTVKIPLAFINSDHYIQTLLDGEINLNAYAYDLYNVTSGVSTSGTYEIPVSGEAELSAPSPGIDLDSPSGYQGVTFTVQEGTFYDSTATTPILSAVLRDLTFNASGRLTNLGPRRWQIIDNPGPCSGA